MPQSMPWDLIRGWIPVRVKKTRQNNNLQAGTSQRFSGGGRDQSDGLYTVLLKT
jgi:hypothetical protein